MGRAVVDSYELIWENLPNSVSVFLDLLDLMLRSSEHNKDRENLTLKIRRCLLLLPEASEALSHCCIGFSSTGFLS